MLDKFNSENSKRNLEYIDCGVYIRSMDEVKKMFQTLVNGQSSLKQEILKELKKVNTRIDAVDSGLRTDMKKGFTKIVKRLDVIGKTVAFLEEDTPTRDEYDELEKRVDKIETKLQS